MSTKLTRQKQEVASTYAGGNFISPFYDFNDWISNKTSHYSLFYLEYCSNDHCSRIFCHFYLFFGIENEKFSCRLLKRLDEVISLFEFQKIGKVSTWYFYYESRGQVYNVKFCPKFNQWKHRNPSWNAISNKKNSRDDIFGNKISFEVY